MDNPGLAPYDISGYQGIRGKNYFELDPVLLRLTESHSRSLSGVHARAMQDHLRGFGKLASETLDELVEACHKEGRYGEIVHYNRTGERIDEVRYSTEQKLVRKLAYDYGLVNLDFHPNWPHEFTFFHKMAMAYLANFNGESGYTCPLAMTDGMILALKEIGSEEQKKMYLPLIAHPGSDSHFMCGQYVTERVGGSNVAANRTVAVEMPDGSYRLNGEKWFCSNPGDLWVTTARLPSNTIGLFLVSRLKRDGTLNGCRLLRKKDIIGTRGKITVETVYEDCEAQALGRVGHGLANLLRYVIKTSRLHVAVSALGMARRAILEARAYVNVREAYGRRVVDYPVVRRALAVMEIRQAALTVLCFWNYELNAKSDPLALLLTPLLKLASTVHASRTTHEAILLLGGNGILHDFSILPRLHNDSIINETWEGTHQIIAEHALKAFERPAVQRSLERFREEVVAESSSRALLLEMSAAAKGILQGDRSEQMDHRLSIAQFLTDFTALIALERELRSGPSEYLAMVRDGHCELALRAPQISSANSVFRRPELSVLF
ncbi:MAG: acyl-CoA dehydrogenase family protein [Spirochaetales bacterium]|nr:acyl-CoA dehydrogenase family protein [Spirochaetales bacterium]